MRLAFSLLLACASREATAQSLGIAPGRDLPEWVVRWSPLSDVGSLPRRLPSASMAALSLLHPPEKVGLFWTAGNPAALAWEVQDRRTDLSVTRAGESGTYRRPLDPAEEAVSRVATMGWQPLESNGAVLGRLVFDRTITDPSTRSNVNYPYASIPLVVTDTSLSALRQTRALLEGAGGWRFGGERRLWGAGFALGYDTRTTGTIAAPFVRRNRAVLPAATIGVVRELRAGRIHVGARVGWQGGEETVNLASVGATGAVFQLEGYRDVSRQSITSTPYFRRMSRRALFAGPTLGGAVGSSQWVVHGEVGRYRERQTNAREDDPLVDAWSSRSLSVGAAWRVPAWADRSILVMDAKTTIVSGEARLYPDKTGLSARENETSGRASWRLKDVNDTWVFQLEATLILELRERNDSASRANSRIDAITPGVSFEAERKLFRQLSILGGAGVARYGGNGLIPSTTGRDSVFIRFFAPELDMATSIIVARELSAGFRFQVRQRATLWLIGRAERLDPRSKWAYSPRGVRDSRSVGLGVTLSPEH